jgi:hypothetical protein
MKYLNKKEKHIQIILLLRNWIFHYKTKNEIILKKFIFFLKNNNINITKINRNNFFKIFAFEEYYSKDKKKIDKLVSKYQKYFEVMSFNQKEILIYFNGRLINIYFEKQIPKNIPYIFKYLVFFYKIQNMYPSNSYINFLKNRFNKIFFNKNLKLSFEQFKNLNFKFSYIDQYLRKDNLELINSYNQHFKIKDIINFFNIKKNKDNLYKKRYFKKNMFINSLNSIIPLHLNKKYWLSSNFFLASNIINGLKFKKQAYENQTRKNNFYNYIFGRTRVINNTKDIKKLINTEDLIIINNRPYNARNRLFAMVGHILNGGKYIAFRYRNYFYEDIEKKILINVFAEIFEIYKYKFVQINNLDNNYRKLFELRGIKIYDDNILSKKIKRNQVEFILNNKKKKFRFIEINNILSLLPSLIILLFIKKNKTSCFYLDRKKICKIFYKKKMICHFIRIFMNILNPKILFVIE